MTKVAIVGTQGGGKSFLCNTLHSICRSQHKKTIVITEIADDCPHRINENASPRAREWIFHEQLRRELAAHNADPDIILCDRAILDNLCYFRRIVDKKHNLFQSRMEDTWEMLYGIAKEWMRTYDYVVRMDLNLVWLQSGNNKKRSKDIRFAKEIDRIFDDLVDPYVNITEEELISILDGETR